MKLLLLTPEYRGSGGGIITLYRALLPVLRELGVRVRVIEGSGMHAVHDPDVRDEDGITTEILDRARLDRFHARLGQFEATPALRLQLAAAWAMWEQAGHGQDCDIVEACDFGLSFVPPAIEADRPLVVQCHGSIGQIAVHDPIAGAETEGVLVRLIEQVVLRSVQAIHTFSEANAAFWRHQTGRHVHCCYPGLVLPEHVPNEVSDRGLVVGRIQRWKGPDVLCSAIARLDGRAPLIDWLGRDMLWTDRSMPSSKYLARSYPTVWNRFVLPGPPVSPAEVARRQAQALFNIVPSTWDVFNFTAVEAMASGRPTIVSTGAGANELIESGRNGYVFPSNDATALATIIDDITRQTPAQREAIGRAGRETIEHRLDGREVARLRVQTYRNLIRDHRTSPTLPLSQTAIDACRPSETEIAGRSQFLEGFPTRTLMAHVARRIRGRASQKAGQLAGMLARIRPAR